MHSHTIALISRLFKGSCQA